MALDDAGIPFLLSGAQEILDEYLGNDILTVEPRGTFRGSLDLSEVRERLNPDAYRRLVTAIEWEPVEHIIIK
jgi:hypothetical protein